MPRVALKIKTSYKNYDYIADKVQGAFFNTDTLQQSHFYFRVEKKPYRYFEIQNRRYLGNKYKLLHFIEAIIKEKCDSINSLCDIFAGTGVVGERFNKHGIKVISNDILFSNYICLKAFLESSNQTSCDNIAEKVDYLNNLQIDKENYFSYHFGGTYFTEKNARKIGLIREHIEKVSEHQEEKNILICALLYAADKVANTVGHYDAFRKKLDAENPLQLLVPNINYQSNMGNEIYNKDANQLIKKIECDVLYIDPPYNSRQYSDTYHILENLAEWKKPSVFGVAKKMDRSHIKSHYCLQTAEKMFANLIKNARCKHILLSYNNTENTKDSRSNARIKDNAILRILGQKGDVEIFEQRYRSFTTGKSSVENNKERIFYCKVR